MGKAHVSMTISETVSSVGDIKKSNERRALINVILYAKIFVQTKEVQDFMSVVFYENTVSHGFVLR